MANIIPFRGIRFDPSQAGDLSRILSPPYDVISPEQRRELHDLSPYNYVRLVLGEEHPDDTESENRFTRAAGYLNQWMESGILYQDSRPGFYRQRIRFEVDGKPKELTALTCLVQLMDYADGVILPHEKTLKGPKEGLIRLMDSTGANLDSVWMMYEDNEGTVGKAHDKTRWEPLISSVKDSGGVEYSLDSTHDPSAIYSLQKAFKAQPLIIADGHHRYETALNYGIRKNQELPEAEERPWEYVMVTLVWTDDPGLTVLPTHRVVRDLPDDRIEGLAERLGEKLKISEVNVDSVTESLEQAPDASFVGFEGKSAWVASLEDDDSEVTGAEVLQDEVLANQLGFDVANLKTDPRIAYVEHSGQAMEMVKSGQWQCAFLLKPIPVRTITQYAQKNRCMPQKSTYFYPKLASGLVLRLIEPENPDAV